MSVLETSFYVIGGTLPRDAPSYVSRQADRDLHAGLTQGHFCYVLTSRQMGKSSLMVRTATRLREEGVAVVVLDLTALGQNLTAEQWYAGLLDRIGQQLDLEDELEDFLLGHEHLGPLQRWMRAVRQVLEHRPGPLVIFIDEIDAVRGLPFSTDEFFAGIREFYNRRTEDPALNWLTFCLLGVAAPSDLIRDTRTTPFNIGQRIELHDFTAAEAAPLVRGLGRAKGKIVFIPSSPAAPLARGLGRAERLGLALLQRVLYWTGGHPYLTQRLCQAVAEEDQVNSPVSVDRLCEELFLSHRAQERDDNLLFVRERLLRSEADLAGLLELYQQVHQGKRVKDDPGNPLISLLRLSGITRVEKGYLQVRNRIYHRVFDRTWVGANMPDAELRRQRAAYRRGVLRSAAIATVILAVMAILVFFSIREARRAEQQELSNRRLLYAAHLNLAYQAWESANVGRVLELLEGQRPRPGQDLRGFEWYYLWRLCHNNLLTVQHKDGPVDSVAFSPDGKILATGSLDNTVKLWGIATMRELTTLQGHTGGVKSVAFSPDGKALATGSSDKTVKLWDVTMRQELATLQGHTGRVLSVAFSSDGKILATGSEDHTVRLWDVATKQELATLQGHTRSVSSVAFSPDGKTLATGSEDRTLKLWDIATMRELTTLKGHTDWVTSVSFSPDGKTLATGGADRTVKLWDVATRQELATLKGHNGPIYAAFSPDGKTLATGSWDGTAKLWNAATKQELATLKGHNAAIYLAFSPDGKRLATGSFDSTVKLWDMVTRQELATLKGHRGGVDSVAFSPDGKTLATGSEDRTLKLWHTAIDRQVSAQRK